MASLRDIETTLAVYVPLVKEITGKDITLERMRPLMSALGNPQERLRIVHIAGTSGKTSTAYFITSLLSQAGLKVGLTVSPHVDSVLERVQVNLQPLSANEFKENLDECIRLVEAAGVKPTYFELLTGFAYWYFAKAEVDYAVIETGLGGLHDATNIADHTNKLCVITDIGLDHMHVLGSTVREIARQKAGIIHAGNDVLMYRQDDEITEVFSERCREVEARLHLFDQAALAEQVDASALPEFQQRNWLLAAEAYKFLQSRDALPDMDIAKMRASMKVQIPGRMDMATARGKTIIMDGAHNEQKMSAFVTSFQHAYPGKKVPVLLSLKEGKEFAAVLPLLKPITSTLIITTFAHTMDLPAVSVDSHELMVAAEKFGFEKVVAEPDQDAAYSMLTALPEEICVITGSFYLLGQLRAKHQDLQHA